MTVLSAWSFAYEVSGLRERFATGRKPGLREAEVGWLWNFWLQLWNETRKAMARVARWDGEADTVVFTDCRGNLSSSGQQDGHELIVSLFRRGGASCDASRGLAVVGERGRG